MSKVIKIVVASPSDVKAERNLVEKAAADLNQGIAADRGLRLEIVRWEMEAYPGFNPEGPQGLIDPILGIKDSDILIGIFWKWFGTPTKDAKSGTEHEFRVAYESWMETRRPQIMVYFNQEPYNPRKPEEADQWRRVLEFQEEFPKEGLWWEYTGQVEFEKLVSNHLTKFIEETEKLTGPPPEKPESERDKSDDTSRMATSTVFADGNILVLDFEFQDRAQQFIPIAYRHVRVPYQKLYWGWGLFKIRKKTKIRIHRLWVEVDFPEPMRVKDPSKLIVLRSLLQSGQPLTNELTGLVLETERSPYELLFDPNQVIDYTDLGKSEDSIRIRLKIQFEASSPIIDIEDLKQRLRFQKATPQIFCSLDINYEFQRGYGHHKDVVQLGTVRVRSTSPYHYVHPLDCIAHITFDNRRLEDMVFFGNVRDIVQTDPTYGTEAGGLRELGEELKPVTKIKADRDGSIIIENLLTDNDIVIPVFIDLSRIDNPIEPHKFFATARFEFTINGREVLESEKASFIITPDTRTTALQLEVRYRNKRISAGGLNCVLPGRQLCSPGEQRTRKAFRLRLGNYAESGAGAVHVRNFQLSFELDPDHSPLIPVNGRAFEDVFHVEMEDRVSRQKSLLQPRALPTSYDFPDQQDSYRDFEIRFRYDAIADIPEDIARVRCKVAFDYLDASAFIEGEQALQMLMLDADQHCEFSIEFELEKDPGPYWLAVDFGTSRIAVAFDKQAEPHLYLLDLQDPLRAYVQQDFGLDAYTEESIPEYGTPFLSSTVLLRNEGIIGADDRINDLVYLAPPRRQAGGKYVQIPDLRSLIGAEALPALKDEYNWLKYRERQDGELYRFSDKPLQIKDILMSTYNRLLRDFVVPVLKNTRRKQNLSEVLNKVIFTIPNTFTPRHVDYLKALVGQRFSHYFKKNYIAFLSESDALACHYIANWLVFNQRRSEDQKQAYRTKPEYVLIYDMGASTLDMTYFKIEPCKDNQGKRYQEVTILGRMGTITADNYLDYAIASAIVDLHDDKFTCSMFGSYRDPQTPAARMEFKYFVQNKLKPHLHEDRDFTISPHDMTDIRLAYLKDDVVVSSSEVLHSPQVQRYIQINTRDVLANFFELFKGVDQNGETDEEVQTYRKGEFPLDTVVLSGRGIQFKPLQRALREEIQQWAHDDDITFIDDLDEAALKSAVVEGALQFATIYRQQGSQASVRIRNRNIQARYGILYQDAPGQWAFKELLNPSTLPIEKEPIIKDGFTIFQYDTDIFDVNLDNDYQRNYVDLSETPIGYFVQSYACDTAHDFQKKNWDYVTIMFEFSRSGVWFRDKPDRVPVRVQVNWDNEMIVSIGDMTNDPLSPMRTKLQDSETFRNSMWPFFEVPG